MTKNLPQNRHNHVARPGKTELPVGPGTGSKPARLPVLAKIRLFNPHRLNEAELEQSFIARQDVYRAILDDVAATAPTSVPQHHLVVGQRGMGKTTLLRRLALELQRAPNRDRFLPLTFPEEQYVEVDRLAKFWLNCLDAMADTLEHQGADDAVRAIDATVARLTRLETDERTYEEQCRAAFADAWRKQGRRPVLFVENFNLLLGRCRSEEYILRGAFSASGAPVLVAASTVYARDFEDYGSAFYDGFKPHYLHPLELDEIRDIILRLAQASQRTDLIDRIHSQTPRLAALRDLTGGNPRTAVLLFELFTSGFSEDAFEDLESLLDVVTPLYQSRLDQLPDQAQTIVGVLARNWAPMTKASIAETARLKPSSVSPQLGRLRDIGLVEETDLARGKKTGYQIAERFFNIWYLMRFTTRRQRSCLSSLARFLEDFHTPAERARSARELLGRARFTTGNITYAMALADSLAAEPGLARELDLRAQLELIEQCEGVRERIARILEPGEIVPKAYEFSELKRRLASVVPPDSPVTGREFAELVLGSPAMVPGGISRKGAVDRQSIAARQLTLAEVQQLLAELQDETRKLETDFSTGATQWLRMRLVAGVVTSWRDSDEIETLIHRAEDAPQAKIVRQFAHADAKRRLSDTAFRRLASLLEIEPKGEASARIWRQWGNVLEEFGRYVEAEQVYREAIRLNPNDASPWWFLGHLLRDHFGRYAEAEQAFREAIRIDPNDAWTWCSLGDLLERRFNRYAEAEQAYRGAIRVDPNNAWPWPWFGLGNLLANLGRHAEAEQAYREAIRVDPSSALLWYGLGDLLDDRLGRYAEAETVYWRCLEVDPAWDEPRHRLAFLLRDVRGDLDEARRILADLREPEGWQDTQALHEALFAAYDDNWGLAAESLRRAMKVAGDRLLPNTRDDWLRASAVLLHLGFGEKFVRLLEELGADVTLLPWLEAVRAHAVDDRRHLVAIPLEARAAAETLYDQIAHFRNRLPPRPQTAPPRAADPPV